MWQVYGETSYNLVCQMIDAVQMTEEDTFIDLGSGVGQVVLQISASTPYKMVLCIERAECPSRYAKVAHQQIQPLFFFNRLYYFIFLIYVHILKDMDRLFKKWMQWWGKSYEKYKLVKGNFVDSKHEGNIHSSNIIYVNNAAFEPELDDQLIGAFIIVYPFFPWFTNKMFFGYANFRAFYFFITEWCHDHINEDSLSAP